MTPLESDYKHLKKAVESIKIDGFIYIGNGYAEFNGQSIDLTATAPNHLAIAYSTLKQIN